MARVTFEGKEYEIVSSAVTPRSNTGYCKVTVHGKTVWSRAFEGDLVLVLRPAQAKGESGG